MTTLVGDNIKIRQFVLGFLYEQQGARNPSCFSIQEIASATKFTISEVDVATKFLESEKLVQRFADQGVFGISSAGIKEFERSLPIENTSAGKSLRRAFFIMPFGKADLEKVWSNVYQPISKKLGFDPIRIDEKDDGRFKLDQIINEISTAADIIIGDLTYERPNCYFEVGYARAIRKEDEVLLCSRRDHIDHSDYRPKMFSSEQSWSLTISLKPKYTPPKVHFDLLAFDILTWDLGNLDEFKSKFEKRLTERVSLIRARVSVSSSSSTTAKLQTSPPAVNLDSIAADFRKKWEES